MTTKYQHQAAAIVAEQNERLRSVLSEAQARLTPAMLDLRQVGRTLDELQVRNKQRGANPILARQIKHLQERQATLEREVTELQRATQNVEQLIRQIEMSSMILSAQGTQANPWELALKAQVIQGREDERARLAREVHDGPAQMLAHLLIALEQGVTLAQQANIDRLLDLLTMLRDTSRLGLHEMRRFIAELRPPTLEKQGLDAALRELCERATSADTIMVRYDGQPLPRLAPEHEIVIYRVAQEALNNAAKHAPNTTVDVQLALSDDQVTLVVRDDGPGFDQHSVAEQLHRRHWGLAGMRERAALVGAHLTIASRVGHGTEIRLLVALDAPSTLPISHQESSTDPSVRVGG